MKSGIFSPKTVALLIAVGAVMFSLSLILGSVGPKPVLYERRVQASSYSISALGHAAFYETMRDLKRPVERSTGNALARTGASGTLVLVEPNMRYLDAESAQSLFYAPKILLVLPKWQGTQDKDNSEWTGYAKPVNLNVSRNTLGLASMRSDVLRTEWPGQWAINAIGYNPTDGGASGVIQLIRSNEIKPIVACEEGILLGELKKDDSIIWILSDPDIMANHAITKGHNAAFMVSLADALHSRTATGKSSSIVFEESVHGYYTENKESIISLALSFPFSIVIILAAATAVMLIFAGAARFGPARTPARPIGFGKAQLIDNSAQLLDYAGHHGMVLKKYIRMTVRSAAQSLHAPPGMSEAATAEWLDRIGKARGLKLSCVKILQRADKSNNFNEPQTLSALFGSARDIHRWKGEILNESATH